MRVKTVCSREKKVHNKNGTIVINLEKAAENKPMCVCLCPFFALFPFTINSPHLFEAYVYRLFSRFVGERRFESNVTA